MCIQKLYNFFLLKNEKDTLEHFKFFNYLFSANGIIIESSMKIPVAIKINLKT